MIKSLLCTTALMISANAAWAQAVPASPVTAELLEGWQQPDGTRITAVKLTLAQGWKTYWRAPGDAGIPPEFDWRGSRNLAGVSVNWPTPKVFTQNGMKSVGYAQQVVLPLAVAAQQADQPVEIKLSLSIGVCKDICIPETLTLSTTLDTRNTQPVAAIAAALAERPYTASEAKAQGVTCALTPSDSGMNIAATLILPPTGGQEHVVIEAGRPDIWVSEATVQRSGNILTAQAEMIPSTSGGFAVDRSDIRFTVMGTSHAVDLRGCTPG